MSDVVTRWEDTTAIGWEDTATIGWEDHAVDLTTSSVDFAWVFEIPGTGDYWSTQDITIAGQAYEAKVNPDFDGIKIAKSYNGAERIHVLEDIEIQVPDESDSFSSSTYIGEDINVLIWVDDGTNSDFIRKFKFTCISAKVIYDVMHLVLRDAFAYHDLEVMYPDTVLISDVWMSDGDADLGYCMPIPFGTAYIPLPSAYITDQRYYVLGETDGTYTINEVRPPYDWPQSVWTSAGYSFTQSTKDSYRVFQAIIADSDEDGAADANGLFKQGGEFQPISTRYTRSDTDDKTNPAEIIADLIFNGSTINVDPSFWDLPVEFNGAFTERKNRYKWASMILKACHACLRIDANGNREVRSLVSTQQATLTSSNIIADSFSYDNIPDSDDQYDGGYIQFPEDGKPQHILYKYKVGLGGAASSNPTSDTLDLQFVEDTEDAQKLGVLYFERTINQKADIGFDAYIDMLRRNPDQVIEISGELYEGETAYNVVIDKMEIDADLTVKLSCTEFF